MLFKYSILFIITAIILLGFSRHSVTAEITGRLKRRKGDTTSRIDHLPIFIKCNQRVLAKGRSNAKGVFHLSWNDNDTSRRPYYMYYILENDTFLLAKIKTFESDNADITFVIRE